MRISGARPVPYASNIQYHPMLGQVGPSGKVMPGGEEIAFNQYGFRAQSFSQRSDAKKIALLGDSFTEGAGQNFRYIFPSVVEQRLREAGSQSYEVMSFAFSDYGTTQELLAYWMFAAPLNPDIVVLEFFGLNDFLNNSIEFAGQYQSVSDFRRPYLRPGSSSGSPEWEFKQPTRKWWRDHSRLFFLADAWFVRRAMQAPPPPVKLCDLAVELFLDPPPDPRWDKAEQITLELAKMLKGSLASKKKRLIAIYFPSNIEVVDRFWENNARSPMQRCFPAAKVNRQFGEERFFRAFRAAGIESYSLFPVFREAAKTMADGGESLYIPDDGHFTYAGHALAGKAISKLILSGH